MKTVWIINQYASTPDNGIGGRHYYLGGELAFRGWNVVLIGASFHHVMRGKKGSGSRYARLKSGILYITLRVFEYRYSDSPLRVLNWCLFSIKLLSLLWLKVPKPTTIIYSSPSLLGFLSAWFLSKRYSARLIFEVRDIWPLSLIVLGGYSKFNPFIRLLSAIEKFAYLRSDFIFSNLEFCNEHINGLIDSNNKFAWIPNGIVVADQRARDNEVDSIQDYSGFRLDKSALVIGYAGSFGRANSLETLIEALNLVRDVKVEVVLVGAGARKGQIERLVKSFGLDNVHLVARVPKSKVRCILEMCDVLYLGWKDRPLYKYGIAANKLMEYMHAQKPILHAYSGGNDPVIKYRAGLSSPAEDPTELAKSIRQFRDMGLLNRQRLGLNGYQAVVRNHDYRRIAQTMEQFLQ